jgi:hypothetical protein
MEDRRARWQTTPLPGVTNPDAERYRSHRSGGRRRGSRWHWLLWLPVIIALFPAIFNRAEPTFAGLPFYYWGQLAFALLCAVLTAVVHLATKGR